MKKFIAIVLALVMTFALCGFTYDRGGDDDIVYTALGDSASNGYGTQEYGYSRTYRYNFRSPVAYPDKFAAALGIDIYDTEHFHQDCTAGLRSEDLLWLLDPEGYPGDAYTWDTAFSQGVMNQFAKDGIRSAQQMSDLYIQHVIDADIITLDIGLNNFGNFLAWQAQDYLNSGTLFSEVSLTPEMYALLKTPEFVEMHDAFLQLFSGLEIAGFSGDKIVCLVENLLHSLVYSYVDNFRCFDAIIERIYELNPDCELYVLGLYDCFPELYITNDMINIGRLNRMMMELVNLHYKALAPHCNEYVYVDVLDTPNFGLPKNLTDPNFLDAFMENMGAAAHPSYDGHEYMFHQLYNAYMTPFKDVCGSDQAAVGYAFGSGLMEPVKDLQFMPLLLADRAEVANALYVKAGCPDVSGMTEPFLDVTAKTEYYDAIVWAYNNGIMVGTSSKLFAPDLSINRSSLASVLYKAAGCPDVQSTVSFKDNALIKSANRTAAQWANAAGALTATGSGFFNPGLLITRADLAEALYALR